MIAPPPQPTPGQALAILWAALLSPFRGVAVGTGSLLGKLAGPLCTACLTVGLLAALQSHGCLPPPAPPPAPAPADTFQAALQAAYAAETASNKSTQRDTLASLFRQAAASTVNDPALKTAGDLFARMKTAADLAVGADGLPKVRDAIGVELKSKLPPSPTAPLDPAARALCGQQFGRMVDALSGVK